MNAEQARKKSEQGAINAIEDMIEAATERGKTYVDLSEYEVADCFSDTVKKHFKDDGYSVDGYTISW